MKLTCTCGSQDLTTLKFGGNHFNVQHEAKTNWLRNSGYEPIVWLCKDCSQILFSLSDEDKERIQDL